jgi:hypothetical protein
MKKGPNYRLEQTKTTDPLAIEAEKKTRKLYRISDNLFRMVENEINVTEIESIRNQKEIQKSEKNQKN